MNTERTVFKMYMKESCPFCVKARDHVLNDLQASLHTIDVTSNRDLHELVIADTGHKTVPAIFMGKDFIGGYDDLVEYSKSDKTIVRILREEIAILREEVGTLRRSI
jgi:glutaredoxin 3